MWVFFFLYLFQARIMASFVGSFYHTKKKYKEWPDVCTCWNVSNNNARREKFFVACHFRMCGTHSWLCKKWSQSYLCVILLPLLIEPDRTWFIEGATHCYCLEKKKRNLSLLQLNCQTLYFRNWLLGWLEFMDLQYGIECDQVEFGVNFSRRFESHS